MAQVRPDYFYHPMNRQRARFLKAAALGNAATLALASHTPAATVLTGVPAGVINDPVPADHGSNAPGTPDIALLWDPDWDQYTGWPNDGGDGIYQHDLALDLAHTVTFTPASGWNVSLASIDLNVWAGGGATDVDWSVSGSLSGVIGSGTFSTPDGAVSSNPLNLAGSGGEEITLSLTQRSGAASYLGMDNLTFDQVAVPEPTGAVLGAAGLGALALRRCRRR